MSGAAVAKPGTGGFAARARIVASDIKLAHSVFALPFAILGAFLARDPAASWRAFAGQLALVVVCMVSARTWAMLINRLADRRIDAANPRTARRALPSGRLTAGQGWVAAGLAGAAFVGCTAVFWPLFGNPWPLALSVPVLAWIAFYSLTKRFTAACHVFLGGALAASPVAAAIAVEPSAVLAWPLPVPAVWCLAAMVVCWVAGFDIIYALQDVEFDRSAGLFSMPARLGPGAALWVSRGLHAAAVLALLAAYRVDHRLSWLYLAGVAVAAALLVTEHLILVRRGQAGLDMAFFTVNGVVSCVLGVAGCLDVAVG